MFGVNAKKTLKLYQDNHDELSFHSGQSQRSRWADSEVVVVVVLVVGLEVVLVRLVPEVVVL